MQCKMCKHFLLLTVRSRYATVMGPEYLDTIPFSSLLYHRSAGGSSNALALLYLSVDRQLATIDLKQRGVLPIIRGFRVRRYLNCNLGRSKVLSGLVSCKAVATVWSKLDMRKGDNLKWNRMLEGYRFVPGNLWRTIVLTVLNCLD